MTISIVTHEAVPRNRGWAIDQVHRVLDRLDPDHEHDLLLRLDPGTALDLAESLGHRHAHHLVLVPAQANWIPLHEAYERHHANHRLTALTVDHPFVDVRFLPRTDGHPSVDYQARDVHLAAVADEHVAIYDGRDRGSVVRFLRLVLGAQPVILIDPVAQTVKRMTPSSVPDAATIPA